MLEWCFKHGFWRHKIASVFLTPTRTVAQLSFLIGARCVKWSKTASFTHCCNLYILARRCIDNNNSHHLWYRQLSTFSFTHSSTENSFVGRFVMLGFQLISNAGALLIRSRFKHALMQFYSALTHISNPFTRGHHAIRFCTIQRAFS